MSLHFLSSASLLVCYSDFLLFSTDMTMIQDDEPTDDNHAGTLKRCCQSDYKGQLDVETGVFLMTNDGSALSRHFTFQDAGKCL